MKRVALTNGCEIAARLNRESPMDPLMISAASGMKSRMESLDMLANNLANAGTIAFKSDKEFYGLFEQELPVTEKQWTDFSQGLLTQTGNPLNVALSGEGFLAVNSPNGTVYTRNGELEVSKTNLLQTREGYTLRNVLDNGKPMTVDPTQPIDIDKDGIVSQGGQQIGQMEIDAPGTQAAADLTKLGNSYFTAGAPGTPAAQASDVVVHQGYLEQSNVPVADSTIRLVSVMRQFEMMQKALSVGTDMNKAVTTIASPTA